MLVSSGEKNHFRISRICEICINGSFLDIFFEDDGIKRFVGLPLDDVKNFLSIERRHGDKIDSHIQLDQAADLKTAMLEFMRKNVVQQIIQPLTHGGGP